LDKFESQRSTRRNRLWPTLFERRRIAAATLALASLCFGACTSSPSPLNPSGDGAASIRDITWVVFGLGILIFLGVVALLLYGAFHTPSRAEEEARHPFGTAMIWMGGIAMPIVVLGTIYGLALSRMNVLGSGTATAPVTVEVIGHQWWWEVRYPHDNVVTANEIHIPVGQTVKFEVTSADVLHVFWVPQLQGKAEVIPGATNTLTIKATSAGTYRGECSLYCGLQHANMNFIVVAEPQAAFNTWLKGQAQTPAAPTDPLLLHGQQIFLGSACVYCHTIAGTNASGEIGPNLTHLGSRQQLAAGALPNNAGALGGWIVDPQTVKPGNMMPPENFSGPDLQALISYLESLK
jgi:cytochrome c oxidase subunit 2